MSKQTVGVFSLAYLPLVGGAEIAIKEITARLRDKQFIIFTHKFDKKWDKNEKAGNVEVARVGRGVENAKSYYGQFWEKIFYIFRAWRLAEKYHRQNPFCVIWASMASYAGFSALIFKLFHPQVPFLLTVQEGDSEEHILKRLGIFYPIWKKIFCKADHIQVISNYLADFAKRHGAKCPIEVIPNGVNLEKIKKTRPDDNVVITTSRLVYKNGVDTLIEAMRYLKKPAELRILGDGPQRTTLELMARKLDGAKIKFFGQVDPSDVLTYLSEASIFVRPSRSEGLGNAFLEAMAAGLPVIGTPVGGIPDFLRDGETGLFAKVDDSRDLAEKINLLLADKQLWEKIARNGQKLVKESYQWDLISEKMGKVFTKLCAF